MSAITSNRKERLKRFYETSDEYLADLNKKDAKYFQEYISIVVDSINRYLDGKAAVLEVGCGNGYSSYLLSQQLDNVVAIDLSPKFINYAQRHFQRPGLRFKVEDATNVSFKDGTFDVVISHGFIEHVYNVELLIEGMIRVLKRNGLIIMLSPNLTSPIWPIMGFVTRKILRRDNCFIRERFLEVFLKNLRISVQKRFSSFPTFIYREPEISGGCVGPDLDSVYLSNPLDIKHFLKTCNFDVIKVNRFSTIGKLASLMLGSFAPGFLIVARKV